MKFEFATAQQILFGPGRLREVGALAAGLGGRALVVGGSTPARLAPLIEILDTAGIAATLFTVAEEPTVDVALAGVECGRTASCDLVVAMGGGSVLDAGKAIAALLTNPGDPSDYLEVVGRGRPLTQPSLPMIAIPTTAGTGAEVTRNAVLGVPAHQVKVSLRSVGMLPRLALIDPELTYSLPPGLTASTGLDALTQCLEPFVSPTATPLTDGICREGMRHAARSLRRAYRAAAAETQDDDRAAREEMALASLCGGLALANAKLGAVHGLAGPLGGLSAAPHGVICARLLPLVMEANLRALRARAPASPALARYAEVARLLTGEAEAAAADGMAWVRSLCADLHTPPLSAYGLTAADVPAVVPKAQRASSMAGNPIELTPDELSEILLAAIEGRSS